MISTAICPPVASTLLRFMRLQTNKVPTQTPNCFFLHWSPNNVLSPATYCKYSMPPHSWPHVPTLKNHPTVNLCQALLTTGYKATLSLLSSNKIGNWYEHTFMIDKNHDYFSNKYISKRQNFCNEMLHQLIGDDLEKSKYEICSDHLFEACTIQHTGYLSFHQDVQNCSSKDSTFALHIPLQDKILPIIMNQS